MDFTNQAKAVAVDANGTHDLSFIQNPNYGLAIWRGGPGAQPRLAWGTQLFSADQLSTLQVNALDGSQLETLLTLDAGTNPPLQLVAEFWSADGQSLYFSKEPVGIGGYIPLHHQPCQPEDCRQPNQPPRPPIPTERSLTLRLPDSDPLPGCQRQGK